MNETMFTETHTLCTKRLEIKLVSTPEGFEFEVSLGSHSLQKTKNIQSVSAMVSSLIITVVATE